LSLPLDQLNGQTSTAAGNTAQAAAAAMQNATDKSNATPTPTDVPATNAEVTRTGREAGVRESR